jgi:hypothetical protein
MPGVDGVFVPADAEKEPTTIEGAADVRAGLLEKAETSAEAAFLHWEEDRMYTKRESELIQQHLSHMANCPAEAMTSLTISSNRCGDACTRAAGFGLHGVLLHCGDAPSFANPRGPDPAARAAPFPTLISCLSWRTRR